MGRRHNTHFLLYGAFAMLLLFVLNRQACLVQHPVPNRPAQAR